jgi:hypothetical protein
MWMCRGCKDPVQEPAAESVRPVNEISTTCSESSTEVIYFFSLKRLGTRLFLWASVAQSLEEAPFTSEFVGSILATDSCEKSLSTLCRRSWIFSGSYGFLPQGKLTGWVRINTVRKVISQLL